MGNELDNLLNELRNMKSEARAQALNSKEAWSKITQKDWASLGLNSEEEVKAWIENNPYSSLI